MARSCSIDARPGVLGRTLSAQASRPHGLLGRAMGHLWVRETAALNDRAVEALAPRPGELVLELGCGPGKTVVSLLSRGARVLAVDPSPVMVAQATARNRQAVDAGTASILPGASGALPSLDSPVDAVLTVHTIYFWTDLDGGLAEAWSALRPSGRIVIGLRPAEHGRVRRLDPAVYRIPTTKQLLTALADAGFVDTAVDADGHTSVVSAHKPAAGQ